MRKEKEKKIDGTLLVTVWILLGLGLVILYSASAYNGRVRFHDPAYYFKKQLFASALGVIGMYAVAKIDYRRLFALAPWFYAASLALSTAVLFFGSEYNGSKRWLKLGPLSFQPSEFAKMAVILFLPWVMEHTAIFHFCGKAKPWKPGYVYRFGVLYHHYAQLTRRACRAAGV